MDDAFLPGWSLTVSLGVLLVVSVVADAMDRRIPNLIVLIGLGLALYAHLGPVTPGGAAGGGLVPSGIGLAAALGGLGLGLAALVPSYVVGSVGAGDAKLLAMVGAFVGPSDTVGIVVCTFACGAAMAVTYAVQRGCLNPMVENLCRIGRSMAARVAGAHSVGFDARFETVLRLPYSVAIAMGTCVWLAAKAWH